MPHISGYSKSLVVPEEAVRPMYLSDSHCHEGGDRRGRRSRQEPERQKQTAHELR